MRAESASALAAPATPPARASFVPLTPRPLQPWQRQLHSPEPLPQLTRTDLIYEVLDASARWVSISGVPGMGRTTLLGQISDALSERGARFRTIWTASRAGAAYDYFVYRRKGDPRAMMRWMRVQATSDPQRRFTLLIDDFDLLATERCLSLLGEMLVQIPQLRLVTVSTDPLHLPVQAGIVDDGALLHVTSSRLRFGAEEVHELCALVFGRLGAPAPDTAPTLPDATSERALDSWTRGIMDAVRGIPAAIGLALDQRLETGSTQPEDLSQLMQLQYSSMLRAASPVRSRSGFWEMLSTFSLMPRFTHRHIRMLFPEARQVDVDELLSFPALDPQRNRITGELVWCEDFWQAALQVNAARVADRREFAASLHRAGDIGGAFAQWLLADDLVQAEPLVRGRFLTVFETTAPEIARELEGLVPSRLRDYPLIRALQVLLYPNPSIDELQQSLSNLARTGAKRGGVALVPRAVRAATLARR